jgi:catechol 2,3-dioxygenase-like lactoylglutathione lyase family enzyme
MPVMGLDHVNIRSADPQSTLAFFRDVLQMRVGPPPGMKVTESYKGGWVFDPEDRALVHVGGLDTPYPSDAKMPFAEGQGGGAVHHVALACADFEGMRERLRARELEFAESDYPNMRLRQLFVREPNGVLLELNFTG